MGIILIPSAMTGLPFAELLVGVPVGGGGGGLSVEGVPLGELPRLDRSELAWAGGRVSVDVDVADGGGGAAPLVRTDWPSVSGFESMNAIVGPATIALLPRSRALLFSGCPSDVTQIATGPLMPGGTTQLSIGSAIDVGAPPTSIWQEKFCDAR